MKKILIFGSGSIGNHMSYASRRLKYDVFITDISNDALIRMKKKIYPRRYGKWDEKIKIIEFKKVFNLNYKFDLIIIGTPPKTHLPLYKKCLRQINCKNILIEKPLAVFNEKLRDNFFLNRTINLYCGYNHSISKSFLYFLSIIKNFEKKKNIEVYWKEGWSGILNAHFWMKDEFSSYLGNINKGGGSLHEHSHGLHLLFIILKKFDINLEKSDFSNIVIFKKNSKIKYDEFTFLVGKNYETYFKYETDLITNPSNKSISISDNKKKIEIVFNYKKNTDAVITYINKSKKVKIFKKTRSSEFENELKYIINLRKKDYKNSNINVLNSLSVMKIIKKILKAHAR